jgi:NTP pyrophosphatase (non-canonical NTP hydrolase)
MHVETTEVTKFWEPGPGRKPCGIPSELADIVIRVAHFCGHHGIDLGKAILEKTEYNMSRPHKHGKQF